MYSGSVDGPRCTETETNPLQKEKLRKRPDLSLFVGSRVKSIGNCKNIERERDLTSLFVGSGVKNVGHCKKIKRERERPYLFFL